MEEKLIEAVRRRTILYDTSHRDYMKSKLKSEEWEEVAKEADLSSGAAAKSVWEKLRHSFRDALRRQKKIMRSGVPAEAIKLWKYQKEMEFLQPFMINRKRDGNLQDGSDADDAQHSNVSYEDCNRDKEQNTQNILSNSDDEYQGDTQSPSTSSTSTSTVDDNTAAQIAPDTPTPSSSQKNTNSISRPCSKMNNIAALMKQNMETRHQMSARTSKKRKRLLEDTKTPRDPLYHFFISMYETTKKMPPASQYIVRNQVYQAVSNMEATLLLLPSPMH